MKSKPQILYREDREKYGFRIKISDHWRRLYQWNTYAEAEAALGEWLRTQSFAEANPNLLLRAPPMLQRFRALELSKHSFFCFPTQQLYHAGLNPFTLRKRFLDAAEKFLDRGKITTRRAF